MALEEINIQNKGPLERAECDSVPDVMVVAGPNGVGKSTLLETIYNWEDGRFTDETDQAYFGPHRAPKDKDVTEINLAGMKNMSARQVISHNSKRRGLGRLRGQLKTGGNFQIRDIERNNPKNEPDFIPYYEVKRRLSQMRQNKAEILLNKYDSDEEVPQNFVPSIDQDLSREIKSILPGIDYKGVEKDEGNYKVVFKNRDGETVQYDDLSSGEKDLIALIFLSVEHRYQRRLSEKGLGDPPEGDLLILVDGPEVYLHPRLHVEFMDFARRFAGEYEYGKIQYLVCTHSRSILNKAKEEELYYLAYADQVQNNQLVSSSTIPDDLLDEITKDISPTVISSGKNILLVEGDTDRDVLCNIYPSINDNWDIEEMVGRDAIVSKTLNKIIPKIGDTKVDIKCIADRDRDLDLDKTVVENVHILPVTCIENLLLVPNRIFESLKNTLIGTTDMQQMGFHSSSDIKTLIKYIITRPDFVDNEVSKRWNERANPINLDLSGFWANESYSSIEQYASHRVNKRIKRLGRRNEDPESLRGDVRRLTRYRKYDYLDGKRVLQELSNWFSVNKKRLLLAISDKLEPSDLPNETRDFIEDKVLS